MEESLDLNKASTSALPSKAEESTNFKDKVLTLKSGDWPDGAVAYIWAEDLALWIPVIARSAEGKEDAALRVYKSHLKSGGGVGVTLPSTQVHFKP